jgi:hypothetical protein
MRMRRLLAVSCLAAALAGCGTATIHFVSTSARPNGALITDGFSTAYSGYTTTTDSVDVGRHFGGGEAIGFSEYRPAAYRTVLWLTLFGNQPVDIDLHDQVRVPMTFWVLSTPFATNSSRADAFWFAMQTTYWPERLGLMFTPYATRDATTNARAASYRAFTCGNGNANMTGLRNDIGFDAGRINVYLVDSVDGSTSRGNACEIGGAFVAIAATAGVDLMSHEMGHNLALTHVDDLNASFDVTNVMHSASNSRQFMTEGQLFRAHLQPGSAINAVYGVRPGQVTRDCPRDTSSRDCPAIQKRLWADGTFPVN